MKMVKVVIPLMQNVKKPKQSYIIKILKDGSFTIPSGIRESMKLKPGDTVKFEAKQGVIYMSKVR